MIRKRLSDIFIASCTRDGGVYRFSIYDDGTAKAVQKIEMDRPMFIESREDLLYAVLREPFEGSGESGVAAFDLKSGRRKGDIISTRGKVGCHVSVCDDDVYVANYISGSIFSLSGILLEHSGHGTHPTRQSCPHVHSVFASPDKKYLLSCDLGLDRIFVYTRTLEFVSSAELTGGSGPRHLCFSPCGKYVYCINEMGGSVSSFLWKQGRLEAIDSVSVMPHTFSGDGAGSAIKISRDGRYIYVTERASGSIVTLSVDGARLQVLCFTDCLGIEPRDIALVADGRLIVCANQFSDSVALFKVCGASALSPIGVFSLPAPICVIEA